MANSVILKHFLRIILEKTTQKITEIVLRLFTYFRLELLKKENLKVNEMKNDKKRQRMGINFVRNLSLQP